MVVYLIVCGISSILYPLQYWILGTSHKTAIVAWCGFWRFFTGFSFSFEVTHSVQAPNPTTLCTLSFVNDESVFDVVTSSLDVQTATTIKFAAGFVEDPTRITQIVTILHYSWPV